MDGEVVAHRCDSTLCQLPEHWRKPTHAQHKQEWASRRHQLSEPLPDLHGARGRALALRDAVRDVRQLVDVLAAVVRNRNRDRLPMWEDRRQRATVRLAIGGPASVAVLVRSLSPS